MDIPRYPDSRPFELTDKPLFDRVFAELQPRISELTFACLYLFRKAHLYRLTMAGEALVVLGQGFDGVPYFLPPLTGEKGAAADRFLAEGLTLYGADAAFIAGYLRGNNLEIAEDRDNFDYLYLRSDLAELPGNRYHKKKNRINYFTGRHDYRIEPFAELHLEGSLELLEEWRRVRSGIESRSIELETGAAREALTMAAVLGLEGLVALVDGKVKAFALGERLNRQTAVCHFEKADPFLDGLYQLTDREFNRLLFSDCTQGIRFYVKPAAGEPSGRCWCPTSA
ncbi:MAG TPA: DUF2156 domain-containing protein, partial [Geobacteraceae bacterium]|nr:DUF2156 domain-containing protein [Geobacteraceae bacterium]